MGMAVKTIERGGSGMRAGIARGKTVRVCVCGLNTLGDRALYSDGLALRRLATSTSAW
jgi:hypothetical protein